MKIATIPKDNGERETIILKDNQEVLVTRKIENGEDKYQSHRIVQSPSKEFLDWSAKAGYATSTSDNQWALWEAWQAGILSNVRDDGSPLAFGMTPAREAESAGGMTKVPKAW